MSTDFRFTPASIGAFKHTARDLKNAYGSLALQQCQEILARIYGYPDLHALQEHLKTHPKPGPYTSELPFSERVGRAARAIHAFSEFAPGSPGPTGRRGISDLDIFEEPEVRKRRIAQEDFRDSVAAGTVPAELDAPVSDYVSFEVSQAYPEVWFAPRARTEGLFRFTEKGDGVYRAILDQVEVFQSEHCSDKEREAAFNGLRAAARKLPNNPHLRAWEISMYMDAFDPEEEDLEELGDDIADLVDLWPEFKACRKMFDELMPRGFKGTVDPKAFGNVAYFEVLYHGARCAEIAGHRSLALSWARRVMRLDPRDSYGARFLVKALEEASSADA